MAVQQDQLDPLNTTIKFETINNERVDRILHDNSNVIQCQFQYPRPIAAYYTEEDNINGSFVAQTGYIDGEFLSTPGNAKYFRVDYSKVITTDTIKVYTSTLVLDLNQVNTSIEVYRAYTPETYLLVSETSADYVFDSELNMYVYTITLPALTEGKFWKLRFVNNGATVTITSTTEIDIKEIKDPTLTYYSMSGDEAASYSLEKSNIIDMCFDVQTGKYYTIRFNDQAVGSSLEPSDDFSTTSGSTNFNNIRWSEDPLAASFFRSTSNDNLVFSTSTGKGRLLSNYELSDDLEVTFDFAINTIGGQGAFFGLHLLDAETNRFVYGVGVTTRSGSNYYKAAILDFEDNTSTASILDLRPVLKNVTSGTETWTITFTGSDLWEVSGSVAGVQNSAATGELYANDYLSFQLSELGSQVIGDNFSFTTSFEVDSRGVSSGTLQIQRSGEIYTSSISSNFDESMISGSVKVELFGQTEQAISLTGDNFSLVSGTYTYPSVPVFTIEEINAQGVVQDTLIEKFNVIKTPSKTYNDYTDGVIQITANGSVMYAKVSDIIYRFSIASPIVGLVDETTSGVTVSAPGSIPDKYIYSFSYMNSTAGSFLVYTDYDKNTEQVQLRTLSTAVNPVPQNRRVLLNIPDWNSVIRSGKPNQLFLHASDNDTLFYLRQHTSTKQNSNKISSSTGIVASGSLDILTDNSQDFLNSEDPVQKGDIVFRGAESFVVTQVLSNVSLLLNRDTTVGTGISYTVASNAEMLQFILDPAKAAFSAVNVDDYSLRAGTGDDAIVSCEVINAWGDPLNGLNVNFAITAGDGVVAPASATTSGAGVAYSQYSVGTTAGPVEIAVSITD